MTVLNGVLCISLVAANLVTGGTVLGYVGVCTKLRCEELVYLSQFLSFLLSD